MKTMNPFPIDCEGDDGITNHGRSDNGKTYTAARVLVGHCPQCAAVLVVFNDHESWPLLACQCGWTGDTLSIINHTRFEANGVWCYEGIVGESL